MRKRMTNLLVHNFIRPIFFGYNFTPIMLISPKDQSSKNVPIGPQNFIYPFFIVPQLYLIYNLFTFLLPFNLLGTNLFSAHL